MGFLDSIKKGFAMEDEDRPIPNTLDELVRTSGSSEAGSRVVQFFFRHAPSAVCHVYISS